MPGLNDAEQKMEQKKEASPLTSDHQCGVESSFLNSCHSLREVRGISVLEFSLAPLPHVGYQDIHEVGQRENDDAQAHSHAQHFTDVSPVFRLHKPNTLITYVTIRITTCDDQGTTHGHQNCQRHYFPCDVLCHLCQGFSDAHILRGL